MPDGLSWRCKACQSQYYKEWKDANKERERKRVREYHQNRRKDPKVREALNKRKRELRKEKLQDPEYRAKYREARRLSPSRRQSKKRYKSKRRALLAGDQLGSHSQAEWLTLKTSLNLTCQICRLVEPFVGQPFEYLTEDHIVPLSKGGTDYISNIQPVCFNCNSSKSDSLGPQ